jgi:hypothetical protein
MMKNNIDKKQTSLLIAAILAVVVVAAVATATFSIGIQVAHACGTQGFGGGGTGKSGGGTSYPTHGRIPSGI